LVVKIACNILLSEISYYLFKLRACRVEDDLFSVWLSCTCMPRSSGNPHTKRRKIWNCRCAAALAPEGGAIRNKLSGRTLIAAARECAYGRRCQGAAATEEEEAAAAESRIWSDNVRED
jgi:hypothetical protein